MSDALLHLIDVLARIEVGNYLYPQATPGNGSDAGDSNHPATESMQEAA